MGEVGIPQPHELMYPVLVAIKQLGGSAAIAELEQEVFETAELTDRQLEEVFPDESNHAGKSKVSYRLAWARTQLKKIGALENSRYGVWVVTEQGRAFLRMEKAESIKALEEAWADFRRNRPVKPQSDQEEDENGDEGDSWKERVLGILKNLDPDVFERLTQRLLREAGFQNVEVLGRSGDGGLDGVGVYRVSLVSFPTYFQCKRFAGSVGPGVVRDLRGAMSGRGEKGLLVTTGTFTGSAKAEAIRDGAPPVDLIDGEELCDLLKQYRLGIDVQRVEQVTVEEAFFGNI